MQRQNVFNYLVIHCSPAQCSPCLGDFSGKSSPPTPSLSKHRVFLVFSAHSVSALNYTKPDQVLISVWFGLCGVKAPCSLVLTRLREKHKALNFWESLLKVAQLKTNAKIHAQTWIYCWQKYIWQIQKNCTLIFINSNLALCVVVVFFSF